MKRLTLSPYDKRDLSKVYEATLTEFAEFKKNFKRRRKQQVQIEDYERCIDWLKEVMNENYLIN